MPPRTPKPAANKQAKRKSSISNEVKLDANNPIPFEHNGAAFSFINSTQYIPFLASESYNYAESLLEARLLSATHNACVTTKKDYCAGNGFQDAQGSDLDPLVIDWFSSMNLKNEPVAEINKQIFEGVFTFGNIPIELVRFTSMSKKRFFVYVHNFLEWRLCKPNEDDIVTHAIQSKLFLHTHFVTADELKKAKKLPIYSPYNKEKDNWFRDEKGVERTLIWYKHSVTGFPHYGLPSAVSSMIDQLLEYKGARYNLDNFDNNMVVGGVLALKGNLGQDEANRIGRQIINTHTGDGKRGRVAVVASEEGIEGSSYHDYNVTKDGSFIQADDKWMQKIIMANQWDAILAGLVSPSTLGKGSGFLTKIIEHKEKSVIKPAQNDVKQKVWTPIFKLVSEWMGFKIDIEAISFISFVGISPLTDVDITPAVQINEVRKAQGLPEDPKMNGVYMKSATPPTTNPDPNKGGGNV